MKTRDKTHFLTTHLYNFNNTVMALNPNYPVWWFNILDVHGKKYVDSPSSIEKKGHSSVNFKDTFQPRLILQTLVVSQAVLGTVSQICSMDRLGRARKKFMTNRTSMKST